jgi:hypothetical protein
VRLLRGSGDNQKCAESGQSYNFFQKHVDLRGSHSRVSAK